MGGTLHFSLQKFGTTKQIAHPAQSLAAPGVKIKNIIVADDFTLIDLKRRFNVVDHFSSGR